MSTTTLEEETTDDIIIAILRSSALHFRRVESRRNATLDVLKKKKISVRFLQPRGVGDWGTHDPCAAPSTERVMRRR